MKTIKHLLTAFVVCGAIVLPASAAAPPTTGYYSITYDTSMGTASLQLAGILTLAPTSSTLKAGALITLNGTSGLISTTYGINAATVAANTFTGALAGNSTTATALAANGANCSAGSYPLGVDASGAVESCTVEGGSSSGHDITTGTLAAGSTPYAARDVLKFDSVFFTGTDDSAANATFMSLKTASTTDVSSTTVITVVGAGTYTTPTNANQLKIRMIGGGGGGGSNANVAAGVQGSSTIFNSVEAVGGFGGLANEPRTGGAGGTGGAGTCALRLKGGNGWGANNGIAVIAGGGQGVFGGGAAPLGVADNTDNGGPGAANTGGGGGGAFNTAGFSGSGGGAGEYCELVINSPGASYSYTVGGGGIGGDGTDKDGGAGGSGVIIVTAHFPTIGPTGATGATGAAGANGVSNGGGWTATAPSGDVYLTTTTNNVGIGTTSPGTTLDVNGSAQFGTTSKSTFSTTGALTLPNDIGIQWGSSINKIDGDSSRINVTVNSVNSLSITPTALTSIVALTNTVNDAALNSKFVSNGTLGTKINVQNNDSTNVGDTWFALGVWSQDWSIGIDNSDADKLKLITGNTLGGSTGMTIDTSGNAFFSADVSVLSLTDRTPYPNSTVEAYAAVNSMTRKATGGGDHDNLHAFVHAKPRKVYDDITVPDGDGVRIIKSTDSYRTVPVQGRDLSATVSAQNEVIKDLIKRIEVLENNP